MRKPRRQKTRQTHGQYFKIDGPAFACTCKPNIILKQHIRGVLFGWYCFGVVVFKREPKRTRQRIGGPTPKRRCAAHTEPRKEPRKPMQTTAETQHPRLDAGEASPANGRCEEAAPLRHVGSTCRRHSRRTPKSRGGGVLGGPRFKHVDVQAHVVPSNQ